MFANSLLLAVTVFGVAKAVQGPYDQCGGQNWSGGTTCVSGWTCVYQNPYYSQCLQSTSPATSSGSDAAQGPYDQCGGQNWSGGTTCVSGWTCVYQNPYYSQCLQATSASNGATTATSVNKVTSSSGSTAVQGPYDQCGGQNWSGGTTCVTGWTCVYQNPYYSQCLQVTSTSSATTSKSSILSSTTKSTSSVNTSVQPSSLTTSVTKPTTSTSSSASNSVSTVQGPYDQCGGQNWSGGTTCVSGWTCVYQNPYYSQCLQVTSTSSAVTKAPSSSPVATSSTKASSSSSSSSSTANPSQGATYKASFTHYGAGDSFGSPNCNTNTAACGFYTYPGYSAAVSQNLYGAGPGAGAGPACGTCWRLVGQTDSSGNKLSNAGTTIVVMVNNLCPADGNPLCAQNGLSGTNQYGANVNFDLCSDSGAQAAFFGNDGVGLAIGTATQVDCSQWSGTIVH